MRIFAVVTVMITVAVVWRLASRYEDDEGHEQMVSHIERRSDETEARPLTRETQPLPRIHVHATLVPEQGEASALLVVDQQPAAWYRCGDILQPDFILSAIDKTHVTVRNESHHAVYEFLLREGVAGDPGTQSPAREEPLSTMQ